MQTSIEGMRANPRVKLQRSVEQLAAAQEVSELEYELAKSNSEAIAIRMSSGTATVHDAADSRTQTFEKYNALEDENFDRGPGLA